MSSTLSMRSRSKRSIESPRKKPARPPSDGPVSFFSADRITGVSPMSGIWHGWDARDTKNLTRRASNPRGRVSFAQRESGIARDRFTAGTIIAVSIACLTIGLAARRGPMTFPIRRSCLILTSINQTLLSRDGLLPKGGSSGRIRTRRKGMLRSELPPFTEGLVGDTEQYAERSSAITKKKKKKNCELFRFRHLDWKSGFW